MTEPMGKAAAENVIVPVSEPSLTQPIASRSKVTPSLLFITSAKVVTSKDGASVIGAS
ncbi:MAG: hypothetical protein ACI807_001584 [Paracoccaceae bacterium]|jgi:hypothetical protein